MQTNPPIVSLSIAVVMSIALVSSGPLATAAPIIPTPPTPATTPASSPTTPTCDQVGDNILLGDPLYHEALDRDQDGLACESGAGATPEQARLTCAMLGAPIDKSSPLYRTYLDADNDGLACETADYEAGEDDGALKTTPAASAPTTAKVRGLPATGK